MADLIKLAKDGKQIEFEKEWAKQSGVSYPLSSADGPIALNDYNRYRSSSSSSSSSSTSSTSNAVFKGVLGSLKSQESGGSYGDSKSIVGVDKMAELAFNTEGSFLEIDKIIGNIAKYGLQQDPSTIVTAMRLIGR
jgi:hypothetical protein